MLMILGPYSMLELQSEEYQSAWIINIWKANTHSGLLCEQKWMYEATEMLRFIC